MARKKKLLWWVPTLAAIVFVALACLNVGTAIWYDEAYSAYLIRGSYAQIWEMTSIDVHPPFYYFCLKTWSLIFGTSDVALRLMSVCFAAIGIVLAYFWLRRWFSEEAAGVATFALVLSPLLVRYSQEMRMYGLVFAIVMAATLVLDIALKEKKKWAWLVYALLICLGMWTHYFAALAWLAHFAYIIYYFCKNGLQKALFWAYPLAVGLFLPWIPFFLKQSHSIQQGFWIKPVSATTPISLITETLIYRNASETQDWWLVLVLVTVIMVSVLFAKEWRKVKKAERGKFGTLAAFALLPPALLMLLSIEPFQPTYMTRYVVYGASLLWAMIGLIIFWGFEQKKGLVCSVTAVIVLLCVSVGIITVSTRGSISPEDDRAKALMQHLNSLDDVPILAHVESMSYYNLMFYETEGHPVYAVDVNFEWGSLEPIRVYGQNHLVDKEAFLEQNEHFWLITENENDYHFDGFEIGEERENETFKAQEFRRAVK